jgi:class 3 adenylate cyclase
MTPAAWPLRPRAARVLYNLADACEPDAGERDAVAALAGALVSPRVRRATERDLLLLEWSPRLLFADLRGFSWLSRAERRAWIARLARSRIAWIRARMAALRALVGQSLDGP